MTYMTDMFGKNYLELISTYDEEKLKKLFSEHESDVKALGDLRKYMLDNNSFKSTDLAPIYNYINSMIEVKSIEYQILDYQIKQIQPKAQPEEAQAEVLTEEVNTNEK